MQTLQPEGESCNNYYMLMVCLGILLENPKTLNIVTTFEHVLVYRLLSYLKVESPLCNTYVLKVFEGQLK